MKKTNLLLSLISGVGITIGLLGCSGDGINDPLPAQTQTVPARMVPIYAPGDGELPVPNDLLFSGSLDLTLNPPVVDPTNFSDPFVAASALDGWSASAPFQIDFRSRDSALTLDVTSVVAGSSVRVFKVNTLRPEIAPGIIAPTGPVTSVERELIGGLEYVAVASGATSLAIIPTVPFEQQAGYMVVLTNALMDSDGLPLLTDSQYAIAKHPAPIDAGSSVAALEPVRQLVNAMESAAAAVDGGPSRDSIILSYQFTVQSVGAVMQATKAAYIDGAIALGATPQTSFSSLFADTAALGLAGAADLYKGQIALNYMLGVPSVENPTAPLNTFWKAVEMIPVGGGQFIDNPLGENLSYANNVARINAQETAPLLVSMPKAALGCTKPANGYPVTIFQHGITGDRTNMLGIADTMAAPPLCTAVVAMDLPIHGIDENNAVHQGLQLASGGAIGLFEGYTPGGLRERTFGIDFVNNETGAAGPDGIADASGAHTINLTNLLVARDNTRQAIFDLLYLEKAIAYMDIDGGGADFDADNISYVGHSLGGIVGTGVVAYSDLIKSAVLANPGGNIAQFLVASPTFGPRVQAGVAAAAGIDVTDPSFPSVIGQFTFAAQTILDAADPTNTAAHAVANGVPTLMFQNLGDTVVPNMVENFPLSGTTPLARVMGLTTLAAADGETVVGSRVFSKINTGNHGSIVSPADTSVDPVDPIGFLNVTTEMQTQMATFIGSGGAAVTVTDSTLLDE